MRNKALFLATLCSLTTLAAPGRAADGGTLTVYTYDSFTADWGPGPKVEKAFEAECGCTLKWVGAEDGVALLNRLKLEGAGTRADIVLGLDTNLVAEAKKTGLFAPADIDTAAVHVPGDFHDNDLRPVRLRLFRLRL